MVRTDDGNDASAPQPRPGAVKPVRRRGASGTIAVIAALSSVPAYGQLPAPDLAASPWLTTIAPLLYEQARIAAIGAICESFAFNGGADEAAAFERAVATLSPADAAYARRIYHAGQTGMEPVRPGGKAALCRELTPARRQEAYDLASGRRSFWTVPGQPEQDSAESKRRLRDSQQTLSRALSRVPTGP